MFTARAPVFRTFVQFFVSLFIHKDGFIIKVVFFFFLTFFNKSYNLNTHTKQNAFFYTARASRSSFSIKS
jgi:hypothetical protein